MMAAHTASKGTAGPMSEAVPGQRRLPGVPAASFHPAPVAHPTRWDSLLWRYWPPYRRRKMLEALARVMNWNTPS